MATKPKPPLEVRHIRYLKDGEEKPTERFIITADKPVTTLSCLDVTECTPVQREALAKLYTKFKENQALAIKNIPSFEDWMTLVINASDFPKEERKIIQEELLPFIKHRTFSLNRIIEDA